MPTKDQHIEQYKHNKQLLDLPIFNAKDTEHKDWAITISFYIALHLIERKLAEAVPPKHSPNHYARNYNVRSMLLFRPVAAQYKTLYDESIKARYNCKAFTVSDVETALAILHDIEMFVS